MKPLRQVERVRNFKLHLGLALALVAAWVAPSAASAVTVGAASQDRPSFDVRVAQTPQARALAAAAPLSNPAVASLARSLGLSGVVSFDPLTGTPRYLARLDGFLTQPSAAPAPSVVLGYVQAHLAALGLDQRSLDGLHQTYDYRSADGTHHVQWEQTFGGIPVFGNELRGNVDSHGRLINVEGSPLTDPSVRVTTPGLSAASALRNALVDSGAKGHVPTQLSSVGVARQSAFSDGSQAKLVIFHTAAGNRLAWHVYAQVDSGHLYEEIVDATSGRILFRQNVVSNESGEGTSWLYGPSHLMGPDGGPGIIDGHTRVQRSFPDAWGPISGGILSGNNTHVYGDPNASESAAPQDEFHETGTTVGGNPVFSPPFTDYSPDNNALGCIYNNPPGLADYPCTWASLTPNSWTTNAAQDAAQVFFYVNNYHDHLLAPPISFTPAAGNFQGDNNGQGGVGGDPVQAEVNDGANTGASTGSPGLPDADHQNNANMATLQDGVPPRMQMYLFTGGGFVDGNGGDEADVVYHEYTHGLSHRLVHDAQGFPALNGREGGAMGEGWSDWYAMDYIVSQHLDVDGTPAGDLRLGFWLSQAQNIIRTEGIDCHVGDTNTTPNTCDGGNSGHTGGYTLADYGHVCGCGTAEVHADGELWVQTLWEIRQLTSTDGGTSSPVAEQLVTRGMELAPPNPSMLDMRNAILQADRTDFGGAHQTLLWQIFARRGMGFFASDLGSDDVNPIPDYQQPPTSTGSASGAITDQDTHAGVADALVVFGSHPDLSGTTDGAGHFTIPNVPAGTYPRLFVFSTGYDTALVSPVTVTPGQVATVNTNIRRDWAVQAGGGSIASFTGPDLSPACGPPSAIDGSLASGWGSYNPTFPGGVDGLPASALGPKSIVVKLPHAVDVTQFAVDPGATCGDDDSASAGAYSIETSPDGSTFTQVASGTFTAANDHQLNLVGANQALTGVNYVRFTMQSPQGGTGTSSQLFMDMSELEVYGPPSAPATCPSGQTGTPPICVTPAATCPPGQTGTPPICVTPAATCPPGQSGTPPICVTPAATCPPGQSGTPPNCTKPSPGDRLAIVSIKLGKKLVALIAVKCPAHPAQRACSGTLTLTTAKPIALSRHGRKQIRALGSLSFSVSRSRSVTLKVKLNKTAKQLLRKAGHGGLRVRATAKTGAGSPSLVGTLPHIR